MQASGGWQSYHAGCRMLLQREDCRYRLSRAPRPSCRTRAETSSGIPLVNTRLLKARQLPGSSNTVPQRPTRTNAPQ